MATGLYGGVWHEREKELEHRALTAFIRLLMETDAKIEDALTTIQIVYGTSVADAVGRVVDDALASAPSR
jgi:hypothetical protein